MSILQAIILGAVQGLTEFLPISSSAHLVITPFLFQWNIPQEQIFPFDVLVQLGTLAAVIVYYWKDLWEIAAHFLQGILTRKPFADTQARLGWLLILATIPAGLFGLATRKVISETFHSPAATAGFLLATALLLVAAEAAGKQRRSFETITWKDALVMGCLQSISVFSGISRSGSTIAGGMFSQLERPAAARFSFLMSVPVMLGAGLLETIDVLQLPHLGQFLPVILTGMLAAAIVGYLSIHWLLRFLSNHSLKGFAVYCAAAGGFVLLIAFIR